MAVGQARGRVVEHFAGLVDPRAERAKRHELLDLVVITICGVICGADNWVEIAEFGNARREWLSRFLGLPNGIPSPDTFGRVFSWLDPDQFGACFMNWVQSVAELTQGEVVAIDPAPFYGQDPNIITTVQGGMFGDARRAVRRLAWERLARSLHSWVCSSHRINSSGPNRSRGRISLTTR